MMAMENSQPISIRIARLNKIILGSNIDAHNYEKEIVVALSREGLLDTLFVLFEECSKDIIKNKDKNICDFVAKYRSIINETKSLRVNVEDFQVKSLIGKGYFGDVYLVTEKSSGDVYAMKKMRKSIEHTSQIKEERDIMALSQSEWVTPLQYAFQDPEYLYLVMEYLPGGDLLSLMIRNDGPFDEDLTRFYMAEITLALNALHNMGYVHRDVKPENLLLDRFGHIKLADFGKSIAINKDGSVTSITPVGTPDYIAPELLQTLTNVKFPKTVHDVTCDYWSMGIIGYELVTETTPFHDENLNATYSKILDHCDGRSKKLSYPPGLSVSKNFRDLLDKLVTRPSKRLTFEEILDHPFFENVNWNNLRHQSPPIIPKVTSEEDISNFEDVDRTVKRRSTYLNKATFTVNKVNNFSGQNLRFLGFTFVNQAFIDDNVPMRDQEAQLASEGYADTIKDLKMKLNEKNDDIKRLQRELLNTEKNYAKVSSLDKIFDDTRRELESMKDKLKEKCTELAANKTEVKTLKNSLKIEEDMRLKNDKTISDVLSTTYQKWEKAKKLSDQNYEKQISEKRTELASVSQKLRERESEMLAKVDECMHLQKTIENYKELLKMTKEQNSVDKQEYEKSRKDLNEIYETKVLELKLKFKQERDAVVAKTEEIKRLRAEVDEHLKNEQGEISRKRSIAEKSANEFKRRMTMQFNENDNLRQAREAAETNVQMLKQKCEDLQQEITRLQEENLLLTLTSKNSSNRSSAVSGFSTDLEFKSANVSIHEEFLSAALEEQLRNDLEQARNAELKQRKRVEELEAAVHRLEDLIAKSNQKSPSNHRKSSSKGSTAESLLERQNEKLEDQLQTAREQAIVERQSARTANLALWKLEKELDTAVNDKKNVVRKLELFDERFKKLNTEKQELEFKVRHNDENIAAKQKLIEEMKTDLEVLKRELKKEHQLWSDQEKLRMKEKAEIIECVSKMHVMEDQLEDYKRRLAALQQQNDKLNKENNLFNREIVDNKSMLNSENDRIFELQHEVEATTRSHNLLKEVCKITETQLNELEAMLEKEIKQNKETCEKNDELWKRIRAKDDDMIKIKQEMNQEKSLKIFAESKTHHLQNELDQLKDSLASCQVERINQQEQNICTTSDLFEVQEKLEILESDLANERRLNLNNEQQLLQLKEEKTKVLTDLFLAKEEITKLWNDLKEAQELIVNYKREMEHLKSKMTEQKNYYKQKDIKSESTLAQHKKLIDYLQAKVEELSQKRKKTLADVLFGAHTNAKKENITPNVVEATLGYKKLQEDLKKERNRSNYLKDQLLQAKTDIRFIQADGTTPTAPTQQQVSPIRERASQIEHQHLLTEETTTAEINFQTATATPTAQQSNNSAHSFHMTMETTSSKKPQQMCVVCNKQIGIGQPYWNCKECSTPVHRKCRSGVLTHCDHRSPNKFMNADSDASNDQIKNMPLEKYCGELVLSSNQLKTPVDVNAVYEINEHALLLGCEEGLYSYHYRSDELVHIKGIKGVSFFGIQPTCSKAILIGNQGTALYQCDLRYLENRGQASACLDPSVELTPLDLSFAAVNERWYYCRVHFDENNAMAIAATASRIVILKFDTTLKCFKPVRALDTAKPVSTIHFTQHTAIVSSDKFFEIDLTTYAAEEFLDMSDSTLREARNYNPMFATKINSQEFLLCFKECGIFVDEYGCRSRPEDLNWVHGKPTGFMYHEPLLFITHAEALQVIKIGKSFTKELTMQQQDNHAQADTNSTDIRAILHILNPQIIADAGPMGIYVLTKSTTLQNGHSFELLLIEGNRVLKAHLGRSMETLSSSMSSLQTAMSSDTVSTAENYL